MDREKQDFRDCNRYTEELGRDYRRLYQMKQNGASKKEIQDQKNRIRADKRRLKNTLKKGNSG